MNQSVLEESKIEELNLKVDSYTMNGHSIIVQEVVAWDTKDFRRVDLRVKASNEIELRR